jgi:cell wall-associated NlpC family hydrolase
MNKKFVALFLISITASINCDSLNNSSNIQEPSVFSNDITTTNTPTNNTFTHDVKQFFDVEYQKLQTTIKEFAFSFLGQGYQFGASKKSVKTDCSLYTKNVFSKVGINLPRTSLEQSKVGVMVPKDKIQVGDLLFFSTYRSSPSHVGIYIGDGHMIHASFNSGEVKVDSLDKPYYQKRFLFAKRVNAI